MISMSDGRKKDRMGGEILCLILYNHVKVKQLKCRIKF